MRITIEGPVALGVLGIGVVAGVLAVLGGLHPTGRTALDAIVVLVAVTACVWASAAVHWWVAALAAAALTALAPTWWLTVLGAVALGLSAWLGWQRDSLPLQRAVVAGLLVTMASRLDGIGPWRTFGLTSLVGIGIVLCVAGFGFRRHTHRHRTLMWRVLGGVGVACTVALLGLVIASLLAEDSLRAGNREARSGIELFRSGDLLGAADQFEAAAADLHRAHVELSRPWAQPVRLVPIVAQHRNAAADVAAHGSVAAARIADMLGMDGMPMQGKEGDAEGMTLERAHDLNGAVLVSFERNVRVWRYDLKNGFGARPSNVPIGSWVNVLRNNQQLEAIALTRPDTLLAIAETKVKDGDDILAAFETYPGGPRPLGTRMTAVVPHDPFSVTSAALAPNGDLFLLERRSSLAGGVGMEMRRIAAADVREGARMDGEVVVSLAYQDANIDNMEGLALRRGPNGETLLYMISDDNYSARQRTLLLMFELRNR